MAMTRAIQDCDGCGCTLAAERVAISTEATDERGREVVVAKRWVLCRTCGDTVFDRIGEPSPWVDGDFKTMLLPDEEAVNHHPGGYATRVG